MWRQWSRALELLGRIRVPFSQRHRLRVGDPMAADARGGWGWKSFLDSERLYDVWGPHPESPWVPFHCVPLFAALDRFHRPEIGPTPAAENGDVGIAAAGPAELRLPAHARPGSPAPEWVTDGTLTVLDLPGPMAVEAAVWLIISAGAQPVCTFDNWPHPKGVLRPERTIAQLLRWATAVAQERASLSPVSPPVWICDSERLGGQPGRPGDFDNRYFLDDSILPGPGLLRRAGIHRLVYASLGLTEVPTIDLEGYLTDLLRAGIAVLHLELGAAEPVPQPFSSPTVARKRPTKGFRRSAAGGFGTEVPEPSSGSSG
jgi:hypothetical protein